MDFTSYIRFVFALLFVLGLIGVLTVVLRRYGLGMASAQIRKGQDRRLRLVEVLPIDGKRRAILIRRDDVEHLVILGAESETLIETGIPASQMPSSSVPSAAGPSARAPAQSFAETLDQAGSPKTS